MILNWKCIANISTTNISLIYAYIPMSGVINFKIIFIRYILPHTITALRAGASIAGSTVINIEVQWDILRAHVGVTSCTRDPRFTFLPEDGHLLQSTYLPKVLWKERILKPWNFRMGLSLVNAAQVRLIHSSYIFCHIIIYEKNEILPEKYVYQVVMLTTYMTCI